MKFRHWIIVTILIAIASVSAGYYFTDLPLATLLTEGFIEAGELALRMLWETWWALVLGFAIAGAVEAWVPKEKIVQYLRNAGPKELGLGTFFGFLSSSCSFSAIATAKNLFKKGASAAASLGAFMFASTNLVIEIGLVMWILLGWEFVAADFVGGIVLIILMWIIFTLFVPDRFIDTARESALTDSKEKDPVCGMEVDPEECEYETEHEGETYYFCSKQCRDDFDPDEHIEKMKPFSKQISTLSGWVSLAKAQLKEWRMLYLDIIFGFILAGIIGAFIPDQVWLSLFAAESIAGMPIYLFWTSAVGAVIGVITFVCSVGNVPFAAILWNNGLPFGSVLSYIYADLIVPPIINAYKKYYGNVFAVVLSVAIFVSAVIAGVVVHYGFDFFDLIPTTMANIGEGGIQMNYKAWLNGAFTIIFFLLLWLTRKKAQEV